MKVKLNILPTTFLKIFHKFYLIKPFPQLDKLIIYITLHYITHTEILLSYGIT